MKRFDLVVAREYESNGEKKTQWQNCGVVFEKDGKMWGEVRSIPVNWDGRFQLFEPKAKEQDAPKVSAPAPQQAQQEDLPF
jgi:hypothetical protein